MPSPPSTPKLSNTHRELLGLLLASLACVVVLTISLVERPTLQLGGLAAQHILLTALIAGIAGGAVALVLIMIAVQKRIKRSAN